MKDGSNKEKGRINRRGSLKGAAGGAALTVTAGGAVAQSPSSYEATLSAPTYQQIERDTGAVQPPSSERGAFRPGSDLMVQVLKDLGIEYVASNPGSSFEGLQESITNYGEPPNHMPEFITALHEETSVDMANGYGKAEGKPMCALLHGTIGIQHALKIKKAIISRTRASKFGFSSSICVQTGFLSSLILFSTCCVFQQPVAGSRGSGRGAGSS